ncbi:MAG TPA: hypothetical protein VK917_04275 [Ilumatobacter sp.]|nr:hypothetical protein [Ilumatobacter sp.]
MSAEHPGPDAAVGELRSIRSNDPCASIAMTTIKATIHTLETHWLASATSENTDPHDDA